MNEQMRGRVVVVTGASGGIGSAISRLFAESGARIVVTYHSKQAEAQTLTDSLPGDEHLAAQVRVDDSDSVCRLAERVAERYGTVDVLVNCAGITRPVAHDNLAALDDDLIDAIFRVNWRGAFASIRAFKELLANEDGGLVVNISSVAAVTGLGSNVAYCASKAALDSMTRSLAARASELWGSDRTILESVHIARTYEPRISDDQRRAHLQRFERAIVQLKGWS